VLSPRREGKGEQRDQAGRRPTYCERGAGFEPARIAAIDGDGLARRFRRSQFVKR